MRAKRRKYSQELYCGYLWFSDDLKRTKVNQFP